MEIESKCNQLPCGQYLSFYLIQNIYKKQSTVIKFLFQSRMRSRPTAARAAQCDARAQWVSMIYTVLSTTSFIHIY